jgi:glycerol uptake facilitator-like aquaporin
VILVVGEVAALLTDQFLVHHAISYVVLQVIGANHAYVFVHVMLLHQLLVLSRTNYLLIVVDHVSLPLLVVRLNLVRVVVTWDYH